MISSAPQPFSVHDIPRLVAKRWFFIGASTVLCGLLFAGMSFVLPKKYKAHFVLTIYSKYFQSPLIGEFVPELSESGEARSQRESLIRQVLTPDFLDSLGERYAIYESSTGTSRAALAASSLYQIRQKAKAWLIRRGLYETPALESRRSQDRKSLLSRIEIYAINSTTFQVSFTYSDPNATYQLTSELYQRIIDSLLKVRKHIMSNVRDALEKRLQALSPHMTPGNVAPTPEAPPTSNRLPAQADMEDELRDVRSQLRVLLTQYTDEHPMIRQLREREGALQRWLSRGSSNRPEAGKLPLPDEMPSIEGKSKEAVREVYGDLTKKLNYLGVAIDSDNQRQSDYFATLESPMYPAAPLWPKPWLFLTWGLSAGFFGSLFLSMLKEYFDRSALRADVLAERLGVPVLGRLPPFPRKVVVSTPLLAPPRPTPPPHT